MAFDATMEADDVAKAEVKGVGLPTPVLEKQLEIEKGTYVTSETDSDDNVPTIEELESLRHVPGNLPWICFAIAFVELCERFAYYGTTAVLVNFIQKPLPVGSTTGNDPRSDGRPGALDQGQRASTGLTMFNRFWAYLIPLLGGYLADAKWGRLKTIYVAIGVAMLGHVIIIVSALPPVIKHPNGALGCLSVGIIFFGMGVGGFKPNISPLMVAQIQQTKPYIKALKTGERVVVDPTLTTQRLFMYFYLFINIGSITGQISMVYAERYVGFWLSFLLPTIMFAACPVVLLVLTKRMVRQVPTGSVFGTSMSLLNLALKGKVSVNPAQTVRNIRAPEFWEDVKPSKLGNNKPSWMVFDDAWVDEVKRGLKACLVFAFYPLFWLAYNQIDNNLVSQANTMSLHGVPNDLLNNLNPLGIIIMIPIVDNGLYPLLRKMNIRFTPLRRMCAGFFVACAAMIWAAVVQNYIYKTGACGKYMNDCKTPSPLNVWIQTGSYILVGLAEIMASITGLEYAYTKAPANMKSLVFGFYHFSTALSSALGQAFTALAEDPLLVWNYGSVAIIAFCGGCLFWYCFGAWDKQEEEMNTLPTSDFSGENQQKAADVEAHGTSTSVEVK